MKEIDEVVRTLAVPRVAGEEPAAAGEASVFQETQNRILEHRLQALEKSVPIQAVLDVVTADLLVSQAFTAKVVQEELTAGSVGLVELEGLASFLDLQIRLAKQIVQVSQLSRQIARDDAVNAEAGRRSKTR